VARSSITLARLIALASLVVAATGCTDECEALQRRCDRCIDPNQRKSCEDLVDLGDQDLCTEGVDTFTNVCK